MKSLIGLLVYWIWFSLVTARSYTMWATCDNNMELYIDGVEQEDPNKDELDTFTEFTVSDGAEVLAIQCLDRGGNAYIAASLSNGRKTDTLTWKCNRVLEPGWTEPDFDDSHWEAGEMHWYHKNGPLKYTNHVADDVEYIWTRQPNTEENVAYCRTRLLEKIGIYSEVAFSAWFFDDEDVTECCNAEVEMDRRISISQDVSDVTMYREFRITPNLAALLFRFDTSHCYSLIRTAMNWIDAHNYCSNQDSSLLQIDTAEEMGIVRNLAEIQDYLTVDSTVTVWEGRILTKGIDGYAVYDDHSCLDSRSDIIATLHSSQVTCAIRCDILEDCVGFVFKNGTCHLISACVVWDLYDQEGSVTYLKRRGLASYTKISRNGLKCYQDNHYKYVGYVSGEACANMCDAYKWCDTFHYSARDCLLVKSTRSCYSEDFYMATYVKSTDGYEIMEDTDCYSNEIASTNAADPERCVTECDLNNTCVGFVHTSGLCHLKYRCSEFRQQAGALTAVKKQKWYFIDGTEAPDTMEWTDGEIYHNNKKTVSISFRADTLESKVNVSQGQENHPFICERQCNPGLMTTTKYRGSTNGNWRCGFVPEVEWPLQFGDVYQRLSPAVVQGTSGDGSSQTEQLNGYPISLSLDDAFTIWSVHDDHGGMVCAIDLRCDQNISAIDHGYVSYPGPVSTVGTVAQYICDEYYDLVVLGDRSRYCMEGNQWSGEETICQDARCPLNIEVPENGEVLYSDPEGALFSTATYRCHEGYFLKYNKNGHRVERTCVRFNNWNGNTNRCVHNCTGDYRPVTLRTQSSACLILESGVLVRSATNCLKLACDMSEVNTVSYDRNTQICVLHQCNNGDLQLVLSDVPTNMTVLTTVNVTCSPPIMTADAALDPVKRRYDESKDITYRCLEEGFAPNNEASIRCEFPGMVQIQGTPLCSTTTCSPPEDLSGTLLTVTQLRYTYRDTVTYTCLDGHRFISGDLIRHCGQDQQWTGVNPVCEESTCDIPTTPEYSNTILPNNSRDYIKQEEELRYTCITGYEQLGGDTVRFCQSNGELDGEPIHCATVQCGSLPTVPNTNINISASSGEYKDTIHYECQDGYKFISGSTIRECQENKQWSGSPLVCEEITCGAPPGVENATYAVADTELYSIAEYECLFGFVQVGGEDSKECSFNETWFGENIQCSEILCGGIEEVDHAVVVINGFKLDDSALYSCEEGYRTGSGDHSTVCLGSGSWSGVSLVCEPVDCNSPKDIANARVSLSSTFYQSTATYSCHTGHTPTEGSLVVSCEKTGLWSDTSFHCQPVDCGEPPDIPYTLKSYNDTSLGKFAFYKCIEYYNYQGGVPTRVCQTNGEWSSEELMICTQRICLPPRTIDSGSYLPQQNRYIPRDIISYTCDRYFYLIGSYNRSCSEMGIWDSDRPRCLPVLCHEIDFNNTQNMDVKIEGNHVGNMIKLTCNTGYYMTNGDETIQCSEEGIWIGRVPACNIVDCGIPPSIENGYMNYTKTTYQAEVEYICNKGYEMDVTLTSLVKCLATSAWEDAPDCDIIECPTPEVGQHMSVEITTFDYLGTVDYSCNIGYGFVSGSTPRRCQHNKTWSDLAPVCKLYICGEPPVIVNSTSYYKDTKFGSSVKYTCLPDYQPAAGDDIRFCGDHSRWNGTDIQCLYAPDDSKYEIEIPEANLTAQEQADARIGFTKSDREPFNFWTGSIVGSVFITIVFVSILILDGITIRIHLRLMKKNLNSLMSSKHKTILPHTNDT